ncbi:hypothetical protein [Bradyrhizobium arachidis]|uniref:hypothetical protein n=1 Tax=Bradyrhizobium arachidis TaxID=858423 RepID=UPI002162BBBE|nr:hypothetical protein [Bradyrhizobium arachidis]UVO26992.1 hypothetical protein KUF59_31275 [Bradyrhizobium arachidis]
MLKGSSAGNGGTDGSAADPARDAAADAEYGAVRTDARPVDITNVVATIDRTLSPGTTFHTNIANDSMNKLTDGTLLILALCNECAAMSQIWRNQPHNLVMATEPDCYGGFFVN